MIASASPPTDPGPALLARAKAALQLLRREPDLDRLRLLSYVVAPTERIREQKHGSGTVGTKNPDSGGHAA